MRLSLFQTTFLFSRSRKSDSLVHSYCIAGSINIKQTLFLFKPATPLGSWLLLSSRYSSASSFSTWLPQNLIWLPFLSSYCTTLLLVLSQKNNYAGKYSTKNIIHTHKNGAKQKGIFKKASRNGKRFDDAEMSKMIMILTIMAM